MVDLCGMQFIVDACGNYYRTNEKNQLVVASNRDEASVFTLFEANQRIGGGKKSTFYFTIPAEENCVVEESTEVKSIEEKSIEDNKLKLVTNYGTKYVTVNVNKANNSFEKFDIANFDWLNYLLQFCYMASMVGKRVDELVNELSDVDKKISDILHLVELYDLTQEEELHTMELLKESRQKRRDIKDEMTCLEYFHTSLGTDANVSEARKTIRQIEKLAQRIYKPRQMPELFEGMEDRQTNRSLSSSKEEHLMNDSKINITPEIKGEKHMEYIRKETMYDNKTNDWMTFAREQLDFYQNIPQYMVNLQIEIEAIDSAIEETLLQIEDANYNVAQGYKAFKELKDLRNERKEKQKELQCLKTILKGINCEKMQEIYEKSVSEMEGICGEQESEVVYRLVSGGN